ncbi:MAG: quinoprotein dehydrogenase-associated putative ABC transporter substrate-binding protein, partial [Gammaproteobacteria bacterium]
MRRLTEAALLALSTVCAVAPAAHAVDAIGIAPDPSHGTQLRVCADAGNLPFSNAAGEGFENAIAAYVATRLERELVYTWWPQRMGFVRNTLSAGKCDLIIGVPARYDRVLTTAPYYCSGYAAVSTPPTARDALDMERWSARRIGVVEQTPPLELLHRHDALGHAEVYPVIYDYDDYAPGAIVDAVARGELDLALLWGPRAGPLAARATAPLDVTLLPVSAPTAADLPLRFAIAMGVRRSDTAFAARLDELLVSDQAAIDAILDRHHVPRLPLAACGAAQKVAAPAHAGSMVKVAASKGGSEPATGPASGGNAGTTRQDAGARRDDDKAQQGAQVSGQRRDSDDGAAAGTGAQKAAAD